MASELSSTAKQAFQVTSLFATVFVVGIHYKSDVPDLSFADRETINELLQEWLFGTVARVAVPLFAFAAGLFYFRSFDGTWNNYVTKLRTRTRTVGIPYFITASVAITCWLLVQRLRDVPLQFSRTEFVSMWILAPPAEQLWFLRDLLVLVVIAPILFAIVRRRFSCWAFLLLVSIGWILNSQPFPIVAGRYLLHMETLCFFAFGAVSASQPGWLNRLAKLPTTFGILLTAAWFLLATIRVWIRPDFDVWYVHAYDVPSLIIHQVSIVVGCLSLFWWSSTCRYPSLIRWSGASFFVFLIHEYPLRAFVQIIVERLGDSPLACWIVVPAVVTSSYAFAIWMSQHFSSATAMLTGGRTPSRAQQISRSLSSGASR
ncbi:MAG: acyltransferase [Planctomycetota bacterium]